jgi:hypothetical protein
MQRSRQAVVAKVLQKMDWMRANKIWPNGLRYLWTDAYGVCNLLSLYHELGDDKYLKEAENLISEVYRVLGRRKGLRIGEEPDRDGQYFHYLTKWMFALKQMSKVKPEYHEKVVQLVKDIHPAFYVPRRGIIWKMEEDLSGPYPGYGYGGLDHYDGYVTYRLIDEQALSSEISQMYSLIQRDYRDFHCTQDLGLGEVLWMTHFFPDEEWSKHLKEHSIKMLDTMWNEEGWFRREPYLRRTKIAFSNYGVSVGLQAVDIWPDRVQKLNDYFETWKSHDEYDTNSITHVMGCTSWFPGVFLKDYQPPATTTKKPVTPE